jgi:dihydroorotase
MKTILITNAQIVNEGKTFSGAILIQDDRIADIIVSPTPLPEADTVVDAQGCYVLPGVIDCHVHFRDPGLTHKADLVSESRAAAAGGVTSVFDMPNTVPQTTSLQTFEEKNAHFAEKCLVNYAIFFGATNDNLGEIQTLDPTTTCGVKLFMGSSTGNMLVDKEAALRELFANCTLPIMTHCEDTAVISENTAKFKAQLGGEPGVAYHPEIRSAEACFKSTQLAVSLAKEYNAQLHVAHLTTKEELTLIDPAVSNITAEVCIPHLVFTDKDYTTLGTRIKCNPAVKTASDRDALRQALRSGLIDVIGTDHAPHLPADKVGGSLKAASGIPAIQFVLPAMLELSDQGIITLPEVVEKMAHNPAILYKVKERGFIREGYRADLVLVKPDTPHTVSTEDIESKCAWSPFEGHTFRWDITHTWVNGHAVYADGEFDESVMGERMEFR